MNSATRPLRRGFLTLATCASLLGGCATTANPNDPLEGFNRTMFSFNEQVDRYALKPAAEAYSAVVPSPVRTGVRNAFSNLGDPWSGINNLLQGKVAEALSDMMRFLVNSTFGIFGILDIASEMGFAKHDEDLGQTLGKWGVGEGAYVVLPFFGSRTLRDAAVLPADLMGEYPLQISHVRTRNALIALGVVNYRATLLGAERTLEEATLDKYAYVRDFYLQQRRYKVLDGAPAREYEDFDQSSLLPLGESVDVAAAAAVESLELLNFGARRGDELAFADLHSADHFEQ